MTGQEFDLWWFLYMGMIILTFGLPFTIPMERECLKCAIGVWCFSIAWAVTFLIYNSYYPKN